jgi:uncharacterized cupin superfamily protein
MPKRVDLNSVPVVVGSGYPAPFGKPCAARARQRLGASSGLRSPRYAVVLEGIP